MPRLTRRRALMLTAGAAATAFPGRSLTGHADDAIESHGLSAFGDLAYPADFAHFRYVEPNADATDGRAWSCRHRAVRIAQQAESRRNDLSCVASGRNEQKRKRILVPLYWRQNALPVFNGPVKRIYSPTTTGLSVQFNSST